MRERDEWQSGDLWGETDPDLWGPAPLPAIELHPAQAVPGVSPYTAQKPYLTYKNESYLDFITAPVRHLKDLVTKESAFEKPYVDTVYPKMHLDLPVPDWGSFDPRFAHLVFGTFGPRSYGYTRDPLDNTNLKPLSPIKYKESEPHLDTNDTCNACIIVCYDKIGYDPDECNELYGWCHIGMACTRYDAPYGSVYNDQIRIGKSALVGNREFGGAKMSPPDCHWSLVGPFLYVEEDSVDGIDVYVDWAQVGADPVTGEKEADFHATLRDGNHNVCEADFTVTCPASCSSSCIISGSNTVTAPTTAQYTITDYNDWCDIYWSVSGGGGKVSIDQDGLVTVESGACGTYTVSADIYQKKGNELVCSADDLKVRITNSGIWHIVGCDGGGYTAFDDNDPCDASCWPNIFICEMSDWGSCDYGSQRTCAYKIDADSAQCYVDLSILCWWNCSLAVTCNYSDFVWCTSDDVTQSATRSKQLEWVCS